MTEQVKDDTQEGLINSAANIAMIKHEMVGILYASYKKFLESLAGVRVHADVYNIALKELDGGCLWMEKAIRMAQIDIQPVEVPKSEEPTQDAA